MKKIISVLTSLMVIMLLVGNVMGTLAAVTPNFFVSIADEKVTEGTETAEVPIYIGANDLSAVVLDLDIPEEVELIGLPYFTLPLMHFSNQFYFWVLEM